MRKVALDVSRSLQGDKPRSSLTGQSLLLIARVHESGGERPASLAVAGEAVPHLVQTLGAEHPDSRRARALAPADAPLPQ